MPGDSLGKNPTCPELAVAYGGGQTWVELEKIAGSPTNDTYGEITITGASGQTFSWSSTVGVDAVLVKAADDNHAVYVYAPTAASAESFGDTDLTHGPDQQATSHVSFCYDVTDPTATPTPTPTPVATPTPTPVATPTPTPVATPTPTPVATPTPTPVATPTPTPTPEGGVAGATGTPKVTLPPTDTLGSASSAPSGESWRLALLGFAGLMAAALMLTPAKRVKNRDLS